MTKIGVVADAVDARRRGERRVHDDGRGRDVVKPVGDGFRVEGGGERLREEPGQEAGARLRVFVQMEIAAARLPIAHSAITASMPVPAEGSSTVSPGRMAAACRAA